MKSGNVEMMFQVRPSLGGEIPASKDREIGRSLTFAFASVTSHPYLSRLFR